MVKQYTVTYQLNGKLIKESLHYPTGGARALNILRADLEAQGATDFKATDRVPTAPTPIDNAIRDVYLASEGDERIESLFAAYYSSQLSKQVADRLEALLTARTIHSETYLKAYDYCVAKGIL